MDMQRFSKLLHQYIKAAQLLNSEEQILIEKCLEGSLRNQRKLYDLHAPMVWGVCLRYAGNTEDAEDILQNTFVTIFTKLDKFKNEGAFGGWVRKIAVNTALMHYRSNKKHQMYATLDEVGFLLESDDDVLKELSAQDLLNQVKKLPEGYRVVFNLYGVEGYSHKEIAKELGITESTSRSQYSRARKYIIEYLEIENKNLNEQIS